MKCDQCEHVVTWNQVCSKVVRLEVRCQEVGSKREVMHGDPKNYLLGGLARKWTKAFCRGIIWPHLRFNKNFVARTKEHFFQSARWHP